jgi:hypothetical protein
MCRAVSAAPVQSHFRRAAATIPYCIGYRLRKVRSTASSRCRGEQEEDHLDCYRKASGCIDAADAQEGLALLCRHHGDGPGGRHAAVRPRRAHARAFHHAVALLAGVLLAGGPEVLCILAVALLGKDTFRYFAHRVMTALRRAVIDQPASKARYYTGLVVILLSWLPAYIYAYSPTLMPGGDARIYILAAMDLAFVVSVFLMGGEFWEKVRRIFVYEGRI